LWDEFSVAFEPTYDYISTNHFAFAENARSPPQLALRGIPRVAKMNPPDLKSVDFGIAKLLEIGKGRKDLVSVFVLPR
jgi:hypothetical protein